MKHQSHESYLSNHRLQHIMWERTGADGIAAYKDNEAAKKGKWRNEARPGGDLEQDFEQRVLSIPLDAELIGIEMEIAGIPTTAEIREHLEPRYPEPY